ncbi:MAG: hypothetical protein ACYS15_16455 [Planctomycetota bacterium]|jgi:hypothetical protein
MLARSLTLSVAAAVILAGCYSPSGGLIKRRHAANTYYSTESYPATVTIVDTRTEEPFFTIEIPPGKQLTVDFQEGKGDDPVLTPDLMVYQIFDLGTSMGKLRNSVTVPHSYNRRIDVDYRPGPEAAPPSPDQPLRSDELADRPDWWTPEGGPRPEDKSKTLYDD